MGTYSKDIIKYDKGYLIKNYKITKIIFFYLMQLIICFLVFVCIVQAVYNIKNSESDWGVLIAGSIVFIWICIKSFNELKIITVNTIENKILFKYGLFPLIKVKKININNIKEISINHNSSHYNTFKFKYKVTEYMYNVDLIDYKNNAYRIYQSMVYNNELLDFSKKIEDILNIKINDRNNEEGENNIYKKIII
jgi:hypothetical protein